MNTVTIDYVHNKSLAKKAIKLSGLYNIKYTRPIIITVICLFVIANTLYAFINAGRVGSGSVICAAVAFLIGVWVWVSPEFYINYAVNNIINRGNAHLEIGENKIKYSADNLNEDITLYKEYYGRCLVEKDVAFIFYKNSYITFPLDNLTYEEKEFVKNQIFTYSEFGLSEQSQNKDTV